MAVAPSASITTSQSRIAKRPQCRLRRSYLVHNDGIARHNGRAPIAGQNDAQIDDCCFHGMQPSTHFRDEMFKSARLALSCLRISIRRRARQSFRGWRRKRQQRSRQARGVRQHERHAIVMRPNVNASLHASGTSIGTPGAARFVKEEIQALPPPTTSRKGSAKVVVRRAFACSCSPASPQCRPCRSSELHRSQAIRPVPCPFRGQAPRLPRSSVEVFDLLAAYGFSTTAATATLRSGAVAAWLWSTWCSTKLNHRRICSFIPAP